MTLSSMGRAYGVRGTWAMLFLLTAGVQLLGFWCQISSYVALVARAAFIEMVYSVTSDLFIAAFIT